MIMVCGGGVKGYGGGARFGMRGLGLALGVRE